MKKEKNTGKDFSVEMVIEAIGDVREIVLDDEPNREDLIQFLGRSGKPVARTDTGDPRPSYIPADKLLAAGYEVGTHFQLIFKRTSPVGAPAKLADEDVAQAIRQARGKPTQKAIARELKVAERTLERWRARHGLKRWREAIERYA
jgi:hypothetical protein